MNTHIRSTVLTAALAVAVAVAVGGVAWATTAQSSIESADSMPRMGDHNEDMMDGGMPMMGGPSEEAMGEFSPDKPFDLQFIDQMTMHHQGALMSTRAMIADSDRPELRELAAAIEASQSAQIEQMQTWRTEWYGDAAATVVMASAPMAQMMTGAAMTGMGDMMGGQGERMYLQMMIVHHQLGVDMAEEAITRSHRPEIGELAQEIADEQSAQIRLMQGYLSER